MGLGRKANQVSIFQQILSCQLTRIVPSLLFYIDFSVLPFSKSVLVIPYQVYIIDFGLAKRYRDATTNRHIPYRYFLFIFMLFISCRFPPSYLMFENPFATQVILILCLVDL